MGATVEKGRECQRERSGISNQDKMRRAMTKLQEVTQMVRDPEGEVRMVRMPIDEASRAFRIDITTLTYMGEEDRSLGIGMQDGLVVVRLIKGEALKRRAYGKFSRVLQGMGGSGYETESYLAENPITNEEQRVLPGFAGWLEVIGRGDQSCISADAGKFHAMLWALYESLHDKTDLVDPANLF